MVTSYLSLSVSLSRSRFYFLLCPFSFRGGFFFFSFSVASFQKCWTTKHPNPIPLVGILLPLHYLFKFKISYIQWKVSMYVWRRNFFSLLSFGFCIPVLVCDNRVHYIIFTITMITYLHTYLQVGKDFSLLFFLSIHISCATSVCTSFLFLLLSLSKPPSWPFERKKKFTCKLFS